MPDAQDVRRALLDFLGEERYRKFVKQGVRSARLRYWQETAWIRFTSAHPKFNVDIGELASILHVCHLHGEVLQPDLAKIFRGCIDYSPSYVEILVRQFPHAALDALSSEGRPVGSDVVQVWYCPKCREAYSAWHAKHSRAGDISGAATPKSQSVD
jgi:hypothetical protein